MVVVIKQRDMQTMDSQIWKQRILWMDYLQIVGRWNICLNPPPLQHPSLKGHQLQSCSLEEWFRMYVVSLPPLS